MTLFLSNRDGDGKTDEEGHYKFPNNAFIGNVLNTADLVVTQQSPLSLGVVVSAGQFRVPALTADFAYSGWSDTPTPVSIPTADPANPRISLIVLYIDKSAPTATTTPNNPNIAKITAVQGSAAATPVAPTNTAIQTAVGNGNPYIILASVRVNAAATTVNNTHITDLRTFVTLGPDLVDRNALKNDSVGTDEVANNAIIKEKIANQSVSTEKVDAKYVVVNGSTGTTSRQTLTAVNTVHSILGTSYSYTSGPTPEILDLDANALINPGASADAQFYIAVNGVQVGRSHYVSIGNTWTPCSARAFYPIAANTTVTVDAKYRTSGGATTVTICNSTTDQSTNPSYGVQLRLIAWGRT